jgi:hypothetical protein
MSAIGRCDGGGVGLVHLNEQVLQQQLLGETGREGRVSQHLLHCCEVVGFFVPAG